jgi:epoxyqueuosine reductase
LPADLPSARSIIIVAVPTPPMRVYFHHRGRRIPVVVPPTYVSYTPRTRSVEAVLATWLGPEGFRVAPAQLPLKTLAVRSGLAEYGRNNICYVPGMGSALQLVAAFTELPCGTDAWREAKALDQCAACDACRRHCPTGAIGAQRFLLHAERCLTYHNEAAADFPSWIGRSAHHCLVGCLRCQAVCPANRGMLRHYEDRVEFTERETMLFLHQTAFVDLPATTAAKWHSLEINEDYRLLCRNLGKLLERRAPSV